MLRATFEVQPATAANVLAPLGGRLVSEDGAFVFLDLPDDEPGRQSRPAAELFAHRAGSGPWARNRSFGTRLETVDGVLENLAAVRGPVPGVRPAEAALGGGAGPDDVARQAEAAAGDGLLVLLGSRAYTYPAGVEAGVRRAVASL